METHLIHQAENSEDLTQHLKDNGEKFNRQCVMVLKLLYSGRRYTGKMVNEILDIACGDRRLRDLFVARSDVKRQWVYTEDGKKTRWKEYWLEIPPIPTKESVTAKAHEARTNLEVAEKAMITVFELPDDKPTFQQGNLFP